jgi:hypothetical protein
VVTGPPEVAGLAAAGYLQQVRDEVARQRRRSPFTGANAPTQRYKGAGGRTSRPAR